MKGKVKEILKSNKIIYNLLLRLYNHYLEVKLKSKVKKNVIHRMRASKNRGNLCNIYFLLNQYHGNLGDQAIGYAEEKYITDNLKNYNVISIFEEEYKLLKKFFKRIINNGDVIALPGGGSLGNEYIVHENSRRDIIKTFPGNRIISFPQTIYFSTDESGQKELKKSIDIYAGHKDLTIFAREKPSYNRMKEVFINNKIILTPDIVLYLNKTEPRMNRQGALCCFRADVEGLLSIEEKSWIEDISHKYFDSVQITDMHLKCYLDMEDREKKLEEKFNQFKRVEIVITDRLHGMIFAAITATPCIVMSNYNHKIKGTYDWIKHLEYIKFVNELGDIPQYIQQLKKIKNCTYRNNYALPYYENIIKAILGEFEDN